MRPDKFTQKGEWVLPRAQGDPTGAVLLGENRIAFLAGESLILIGPEMDLIGACKTKDWTAAQKLLLGNAYVNCSDEIGGTALMWASYYGNQAFATLLLDKNADIAAKDGRGDTALGYAVVSGNARVVDLLLRRGADPNAGGTLGAPLKIAAEMKRADLIQMLTLAGGKP